MSRGWSAEDIGDLSGRTAVVTGGNSGIGLVTCRELAGHGARVIVACRDEEKGRRAIDRMRVDLSPAGDEARLEVRPLDLASLESVREFTESLSAELDDGLDLLVNNAGVMAPPRQETSDGFELQFGTNHLGHFALTGLLFEHLKRAPEARVVTVSSNAHKLARLDLDDPQSEQRYFRWRAYANSKLANLIFALDLQSRIDEAGLDIKSEAAHPGVSATNLTSAGNSIGGSLFSLASKPFLKLSDLLVAQDAEHGALPLLYAATCPELPGGSYIGPDGPGEVRGHPTVVAPRRAALNVRTADRLWDLSSELTGVDFDFGTAGVTA